MDCGFEWQFFATVVFLVFIEQTLLDLNNSSTGTDSHVWVVFYVIFESNFVNLFTLFIVQICIDFFLGNLLFAVGMRADDFSVVPYPAEHVFGKTVFVQLVKAFSRLKNYNTVKL